jgi:hypothetical protein
MRNLGNRLILKGTYDEKAYLSSGYIWGIDQNTEENLAKRELSFQEILLVSLWIFFIPILLFFLITIKWPVNYYSHWL